MKNLNIFIVLFSVCFDIYANTEIDKATSDWENIQRNYPQTERFEKVADGLYEFKNTGFDYEGKLYLKNIVIEDSKGTFGKTADIMVELDKSREDFYSENSQSFSRWDQANYLVFDDKSENWVRYRDLSAKGGCQKKSDKIQPLWRQLLVACFPILLIVGLFMLYFRSMSKGGKNINERLLDSNLEVANQLKRIADLIEKKG